MAEETRPSKAERGNLAGGLTPAHLGTMLVFLNSLVNNIVLQTKRLSFYPF